MSKVLKLTEAQLREIINGELNEIGMGQAKVEGPLRKFLEHMNGAKQALGELFQQVTDQKASDQAQALLNGVNRIVKALDHMPELTKDPWHHVGKRD